MSNFEKAKAFVDNYPNMFTEERDKNFWYHRITQLLNEQVTDFAISLKKILYKIEDNTFDAWEADALENTTSVVALQDHLLTEHGGDTGHETETIVYNGWFDDLINLHNTTTPWENHKFTKKETVSVLQPVDL